jgi:hypothetical protein
MVGGEILRHCCALFRRPRITILFVGVKDGALFKMRHILYESVIFDKRRAHIFLLGFLSGIHFLLLIGWYNTSNGQIYSIGAT